MPEAPAPAKLPTSDCTPELHEKFSGGCYYCCSDCNYGTHQCRGCGEPLRHDGKEFSGKVHQDCTE